MALVPEGRASSCLVRRSSQRPMGQRESPADRASRGGAVCKREKGKRSESRQGATCPHRKPTGELRKPKDGCVPLNSKELSLSRGGERSRLAEPGQVLSPPTNAVRSPGIDPHS